MVLVAWLVVANRLRLELSRWSASRAAVALASLLPFLSFASAISGLFSLLAVG